jgi:hypothetical protein
MAIVINHPNINPNIDAYALAYRSSMNRVQPWVNMMDKLAKTVGDVGASYLAYKEPSLEDPKVTVDEGDATLSMNGIDPFLYRRMMSKSVSKPENLGLINPFTHKEW